MTTFKTAVTGETEAQFRQWLALVFPTTGVVTGLAVSPTSPATASVSVSPGWANSVGNTLQGATPLRSDSALTLDVLTANPNPGGNPRNDLVIFDLVAGSVRVVIGTPAAIPNDPAVPAGSVPLARLRHAAGATSVPVAAIDDLRAPSEIRGAPVVVASQAQRDALTPVDGMQVWRTDTHEMNTYASGSWLDGRWTAFTPKWAQSGNQSLAIGNGTLSGAYKVDGKKVTAIVRLIRGSLTNVGTGVYFFDLPSPPADIYQTGTGLVRQGGTEIPVVVTCIGGLSVVLVQCSNNTRVSNASPGGWAVGHTIQFTITYQGA